MEEERIIEIKGVFEFNDFFRNLLRHTFRRLWLIFPLALVFTPLAIYSIASSGFSFPVIFILIPATMIFGFIWTIYKSSKKSFETVKDNKIRWRFSENGYETFTPNGISNYNWASLEEIEEKDKEFLLYQRKPIFIIIPKRFFRDEQQISEFRELVHENLGDKAKLKND